MARAFVVLFCLSWGGGLYSMSMKRNFKMKMVSLDCPELIDALKWLMTKMMSMTRG
jgi:hypothetical protein